MSESIFICKLDKYARFISNEASGSQGQWKVVDSPVSGESLELILRSTHHLLIIQGSVIHENLSLYNSRSYIKGVAKGDSMLIVANVKNEHRKFRMRFRASDGKTDVEQCNEAAQHLALFFDIKGYTADKTENQAITSATNLSANVAVGTIAEVIAGMPSELLPKVYQESHLITEKLQELVYLCLTDTNFPAFVEQVDSIVSGHVKDCKLGSYK